MSDVQEIAPAAADEPTEIGQSIAEADPKTVETEAETGQEADDEDVDGEEEQETEEGEGDDGDEPSADAQPKKPSRYQRMKRQNELMRQELDEYRRRDAGSESQGERPQVDIGAEPKLEDFEGDWFAYERAVSSFNIRKALAEERAEADQRQAQARQREHAIETQMRFEERASEFAKTAPDFEEAIAAAGDLQVPNQALALIAESEKGPLIAYHLAKNPKVAQAMQGMNSVQIAREIGRLEGTLRVPTGKTQSTAPTPARPVKGGAAPQPDPDRMSMEDYAAWVKRRQGT